MGCLQSTPNDTVVAQQIVAHEEVKPTLPCNKCNNQLQPSVIGNSALQCGQCRERIYCKQDCYRCSNCRFCYCVHCISSRDESYCNAWYYDRHIMTIQQLETFVNKPHNDRVAQLLKENYNIIFSAHKPMGYKHKEILNNFVEILDIEKGSESYNYYLFFVFQFIVCDIDDTRFNDTIIHDLLQGMMAMLATISTGVSIPRISSASVYGLIARFVETYCRNKKYPAFITQLYFGYNTKVVDIKRITMDLIKKGLAIDPNDIYCAFALGFSTLMDCWQFHAPPSKKAIYWIKKSGFDKRLRCVEIIKEIERKISNELVSTERDLKKYEEHKDQFEDQSIHDTCDRKTFQQAAIYYLLSDVDDGYEQGLLLYDAAKPWMAIWYKFERNLEYVAEREYDHWTMKLSYMLSYAPDFEALDTLDTVIKEAFDKAYVFYYLPDYIREDPICSNELFFPSKNTGSEWLVPDGYQYEKGDTCKTHSFLFPMTKVDKKTKALREWADDEEYKGKWLYSLSDLLYMIEEGCNALTQDNVDIVLRDKQDGDDKPLFWDALCAVWRILSRYEGERYKSKVPQMVQVYSRDIIHDIFNKLLPIFDYIAKYAAKSNIDQVFSKLNELWICNNLVPEFCVKMIHLMVEKATEDDDDEKKELNHDDAQKRFEGQVNILSFLNKKKSRTQPMQGWLHYRAINKTEIVENIKQQYQARLDTLGAVLTDYYNNELFKDTNYDAEINSICDPSDEELILRQDKKAVLTRCRWGPLDADKINEERYREEMVDKYGLNPVDNLKTHPIKGSFKNGYVDFVIKIGDKLQGVFQKDMRQLFADTNGEYHEAPIKKFERCLQKMEYDYKDEKEPVGAHILDIVRCLVVYENISELVKAYHKLASKYRVCRLKNNFIKTAQVFGNYRCLMVNILYQHPQNENIRMICEVQLTLRKVYLVRLTMHKTYKLFRAVLPENDAMLF